jgi:hypothetical protein
VTGGREIGIRDSGIRIREEEAERPKKRIEGIPLDPYLISWSLMPEARIP